MMYVPLFLRLPHDVLRRSFLQHRSSCKLNANSPAPLSEEPGCFYCPIQLHVFCHVSHQGQGVQHTADMGALIAMGGVHALSAQGKAGI